MSIIKKILDPNERELSRLRGIVEAVNALEPDMQALSDDDLRAKTHEFRDRLAAGAALDGILPEAFAAVREAAVRAIGQRPFDVQVIGGIVLYEGRIAEMKTGEGKTLAATMPAYLRALEGKGVHVVTVNDYLAKRDAEWMGEIYRFLGLTVGYSIPGTSLPEKQAAYRCDITYCQNSELGFDYLRDNMAISLDQLMLRDLHYAIVDEVDSILIDEARTPLIMSGPVERETSQHFWLMAPHVRDLVKKQQAMVSGIMDGAVKLLDDPEREYEGGIELVRVQRGDPTNKRLAKLIEDRGPRIKTLMARVDADHIKVRHVLDEALYYSIDERGHSVNIADRAFEFLESRTGQPFELPDTEAEERAIDEDPKVPADKKYEKRQQLYAHHQETSDRLHAIRQLLKAHALFEKDVAYVVQDGKVIIVDEFTGRLQPGRRFSDGLHEALEAKERVQVENPTQTMATITYQNFFRIFKHLAGMTGTAKTEEDEFRKIYGLDVVVIPTNRPVVRNDQPDIIYKTEEAKFRGLLREIVRLHVLGQPMLIGTRSVEMSERLSGRLTGPQLQILGLALLLADDLLRDKELSGGEKDELRSILFTRGSELTMKTLTPVARAVQRNTDMLSAGNVGDLAALIGLGEETEDDLRDVLASGVPNNVLNARYHEEEAEIIAEAGRVGAVTIATNMAGRGVDIMLGGRPEALGDDWQSEHDEVVALGGLAVLGGERHESRRIDNQLRGRSGRQGDPGLSRFFVSFEDELMRLFGDRSQSLMMKMWQEDQEVDIKLASRAIERAQKKIEEHNFDLRKHVLQYDDVMNNQRKVVYAERRKVLEGADLGANNLRFMEEIIEHHLNNYCSKDVSKSEWDTRSLAEVVNVFIPLAEVGFHPDQIAGRDRDAIREALREASEKAYEAKEQSLTPDIMREIERRALLGSLDRNWVDHLQTMDALREGIGLRGYAGQDPIIPYTNEAYDVFQKMLQEVREQTIRGVFNATLRIPPARSYYHVVTESAGDGDGEGRKKRQTYIAPGKVGRNAPCPCGSGKKYKKCCMLKLQAGGTPQ
jgi:preprotein translocase subunit SecA